MSFNLTQIPAKTAVPPRVAPAAAVARTPAKAAAVPSGDTLVKAAPPAATHRDGQVPAADGQTVAYRTTETAGAPKAIIVMQQGTYGQPAFFDGMGEGLAKSGIKSYALGSRVETPDPAIHAKDLAAVVAKARAENPGVPVTVAGVSLGAAIAMNWSAVHNADHLPVVLMSPVILPKYLGVGDLARIAGGLFGGQKAGDKRVHSPMSKGATLTTNPQSPEANLPNAKGMTVPARLFGDVLKMTGQTALRGRQMAGPLLVMRAGEDEVAVNPASTAFTKLIKSKDEKIVTFKGAAHDLSQEYHNPAVVKSLGDWVLAH